MATYNIETEYAGLLNEETVNKLLELEQKWIDYVIYEQNDANMQKYSISGKSVEKSIIYSQKYLDGITISIIQEWILPYKIVGQKQYIRDIILNDGQYLRYWSSISNDFNGIIPWYYWKDTAYIDDLHEFDEYCYDWILVEYFPNKKANIWQQILDDIHKKTVSSVLQLEAINVLNKQLNRNYQVLNVKDAVINAVSL